MEKIKEKVIIVGVETEENYRYFDSTMQELENLTMTAQGEVVYSLIQKRKYVDRQTLIGKGKIEELVSLIDAYEAEIVIFNQELTPRQNQQLSELLQIRVIDRVQLILDIFALRARSKEGILQVELAQLNYLLPRLAGQGKQLSRLGGGIGTRGPGETKLESDRRHIRNKITAIKRELKEVSAHRERSRQKRKNSAIFQMGLVGYTNAGKSTILNLLTSADTYSEDQLFATLDPLTKKWALPQGLTVTLTDTVGFIQQLPTQLIEAFQSTLEITKEMDVLLHVIDASAEDRLIQEQTVLNLLTDLGAGSIPILTVYNKSDLIDEQQFVPTLFPYILISSKEQDGKVRLTDAIRKQIMELFQPYELQISAEEGYKISELKKQTIVLSEEFEEQNNIYKIKGFADEKSKWLRKSSRED